MYSSLPRVRRWVRLTLEICSSASRRRPRWKTFSEEQHDGRTNRGTSRHQFLDLDPRAAEEPRLGQEPQRIAGHTSFGCLAPSTLPPEQEGPKRLKLGSALFFTLCDWRPGPFHTFAFEHAPKAEMTYDLRIGMFAQELLTRRIDAQHFATPLTGAFDPLGVLAPHIYRWHAGQQHTSRAVWRHCFHKRGARRLITLRAPRQSEGEMYGLGRLSQHSRGRPHYSRLPARTVGGWPRCETVSRAAPAKL